MGSDASKPLLSELLDHRGATLGCATKRACRSPLKFAQNSLGGTKRQETSWTAVLSCIPGASLVPPRLSPGSPIGPFLPPWCLPGLVLSCLPGASLVPPRLSKWSFPASLVSSRSFPAPLVPPWCLAGCPIGPFLLPGASLVSARLSKWSFPAGDPPGSALASGLPSAKQISMATSPFCAKSWGGPYGRLPVPQNGAPVAQNCLSKAFRSTDPSSTAPKVCFGPGGPPHTQT